MIVKLTLKVVSIFSVKTLSTDFKSSMGILFLMHSVAKL